ncbi:unnamed protein product [Ectocarpus sp. 4 AP-2014]
MLGMIQSVFARTRHVCRQTGARFCGRNSECDDGNGGCCCCCGCGRPETNGGNNGSGGGGGGSSCGSRRAGLCCSWLSSLLLGWDWLPIATSGAPVAGGGGHALGGSASAAIPRHSSGGTGRGGGGGGGAVGDMAVALGSGDTGGVGATRRLGSSSSSSSGPGGGSGGGGEDAKPLLSHSKSAEFREKERRFIKGRFVLPGNDVQRRIADAMAGVLAAGERAMSGTDASGATGGAIGPNRNHSGAGGGEGYREITDRGPPSAICHGDALDSDSDKTAHEDQGRFRLPSSSQPASFDGTARGRMMPAGGAIGSSSHLRASPRQGTSNEGFRGGSSAVAGLGGKRAPGGEAEEERECVICMEEFSKENPEMLTLCSCGVNKTFFHYTCLLQWLSKHSYCPACRGYLFFEERRRGGGDDRSQDRSSIAATTGTTTTVGGDSSRTSDRLEPPAPPSSSGRVVSNEDYGRAFRRALRAGLGGESSPSSPRGAEGNVELL